jgi:signal peptidase I
MDIVEYINNINKDNANKFIASTSSNITVKRDIDACVSDTSWIDMVEECIPYLDNIIRNPRRFIVQEENIVPIEKAKVVTEESIRHLAQHTSMIQEVQEDGTVIPLKLLNVYREETVDLYENRFIKSLVDNLYTFVNNKLNESDQRSYAKVESTVSYSGLMKKKGEEVEVNLQLKSKKDTEIDASKDGHSLEERISHIKDIVSAFRGSTFIKSLKESSPVRSPIRKTNVILKEQNFIKALELWEYLEKNNIKPITSIDKRTEIVKDADIKTKYDLAFFIDNDAIDMNAASNKSEFNSAIISKLVNDFVFTGDITEKEFKKLLEKEFKEAKKRKDKATNAIRKTIEDFLNDYNTKKKKIISIIK